MRKEYIGFSAATVRVKFTDGRNSEVTKPSFRVARDPETEDEFVFIFVDASDANCKAQLRDRRRRLRCATRWNTEEEFETINAYFQPPTEDEKFNIVRHQRF